MQTDQANLQKLVIKDQNLTTCEICPKKKEKRIRLKGAKSSNNQIIFCFVLLLYFSVENICVIKVHH